MSSKYFFFVLFGFCIIAAIASTPIGWDKHRYPDCQPSVILEFARNACARISRRSTSTSTDSKTFGYPNRSHGSVRKTFFSKRPNLDSINNEDETLKMDFISEINGGDIEMDTLADTEATYRPIRSEDDPRVQILLSCCSEFGCDMKISSLCYLDFD